MKHSIVSLNQKPAMKEELARWFHEKWSIPYSLYVESMDAALCESGAVPRWYAAMEDDRIVGGVGVIQNDFHPREDLAPNLCALYVEESHRGRGIAGELLDFACRDMSRHGVSTLYLVTDHTTFYERYGWRFLCPVTCYGEDSPSRMYVKEI